MQRGFIPVSLVLLVVAAAAIVFGAYYLGKQSSSPSPVSTITPSYPPSPAPTKTDKINSSTESATPISKAKLFSTDGWQTANAKNFSIKIPPDLFFQTYPYYVYISQNENSARSLYLFSQVGIPEVGDHTNLYNGGSERQWFLDYHCNVDDSCPYSFREKLFGTLNGLEVLLPLAKPGEKEPLTRIRILVVIDSELFEITGDSNFSPQTLDTIISTLKTN